MKRLWMLIVGLVVFTAIGCKTVENYKTGATAALAAD